MRDLAKIIEASVNDSILVKETFFRQNQLQIVDAASAIVSKILSGGKVLLAGNGGSAADAQHIAAELVGRFEKERRPLPAIALTTDTSILTAVANDYGYRKIFSRQLEALARPGDVFIGISTSGLSANIIDALDWCNPYGIITIGFTGKTGGEVYPRTDWTFMVPSWSTPRIQETHITLGHVLCELIEELIIHV
jgi:D-sedoheptulose 7-phosphate isomerase